jgi:dTMP kinase
MSRKSSEFTAEAKKERRFLRQLPDRGDLPPSRGYGPPREIARPCLPIRHSHRFVSKSGGMPRLPFITFEGTEGCGKSTQVQRLAARFTAEEIPFVVTREPGGTPIGETIKELLQFAPHGSAMTPETELLLFEASRSQLVREIIRPALARGSCVISDRFFDSTTVYQGAARKLEPQTVEALNRFAVGDCIPDVTFVLDIDAGTAQARMQKPRRADRMEQEPAHFYERVRQAYRALATREAKRIVLLNGSPAADEVERQIWETLTSRFPVLADQSKTERPALSVTKRSRTGQKTKIL